jgi:RNA polymerase primary sigma factor
MSLLQAQIEAIIDAEIQTLRPREQRIIRARFGLDGEPVILRALGAELGITGAGVRGIEQDALRKLRHSRSKKLRLALEAVIEPDCQRITF